MSQIHLEGFGDLSPCRGMGRGWPHCWVSQCEWSQQLWGRRCSHCAVSACDRFGAGQPPLNIHPWLHQIPLWLTGWWRRQCLDISADMGTIVIWTFIEKSMMGDKKRLVLYNISQDSSNSIYKAKQGTLAKTFQQTVIRRQHVDPAKEGVGRTKAWTRSLIENHLASFASPQRESHYFWEAVNLFQPAKQSYQHRH